MRPIYNILLIAGVVLLEGATIHACVPEDGSCCVEDYSLTNSSLSITKSAAMSNRIYQTIADPHWHNRRCFYVNEESFELCYEPFSVLQWSNDTLHICTDLW
ncbi:Hypothetical predicted protein [Cloeon dipterum]|uniref:Uncharacterized protein n=1 Tax=Cloeon dipterum TaxID=197152 RepID=A0A8S1C9C2_9INSE|nr:Hypothetical predicted protein [Cloeon dipterum]